MSRQQTLKLIKGGEPRRRTAPRTVKRRRPGQPDVVAEVLRRLDEEEIRTPPRRRPVRRAGRLDARRIKASWTTAVLCLALAAALWAGAGWYGDRRLAEAHEHALAAAKQTTVDFVSVSAASVDRDLQRILAGSTGDFREEFSRGQAQVRAAVVENNVESRGTVLRAALISGDLRRAVVLVAMDAVVRNTKAPQGSPSHYRIQVEVDRDRGSGRWLVSRLQFVG